MCGRARCTLRTDDIPRACHRSHGSVRTLNMDRYRPLYNASPGSSLPVVRRDDVSGDEGVVIQCMKWGLIPSFTKKSDKPDHYKMFNARSESMCEKASFRRLVPKSRCLVVAEGFYEWKKDGTRKQPYYIHFKDGRPLIFAALYDCWDNSEDSMPVILGDKERMDTWLDDSSSSKYDVVLKPYEAPDLVWYPVTPSMGKPSYDGPDCIKEIQLKTDGNNLISKFFSAKETSNPEERISCSASVKPEPLESLKEEPETNINHGAPSVSIEDRETKDTLSKSSESAAKCQIKRDHKEISSDLNPGNDEYGKTGSCPKIRKKEAMKTASNNQSTLFSYFGKK